MHELDKDKDELKDKVWDKFFEDIKDGGQVLKMKELQVEGSNKRLFKVWTEWPAAPCITMPAAVPIEVKPLWQQEGVI